ncbi:glycosyltransferase [Dyella sp.]|uniref:glycosyltransferase n=1 Tax=Dyella sp. TaxID=1869338 RepID=UPI002ED2E1D9
MTTVVGLLLNYRDASRSAACIASLLAEGVDHVLVWDNSADDAASAADLAARFLHDARVAIEISATNLGFAAGVNRGLAACRRRYGISSVLLINNDARLISGSLAYWRAQAMLHPDAVLLSADTLHAATRVGLMYYQRWLALQFRQPRWGAFPYASGSCLWIQPHHAQGPLFDEAFFMYGEDCELGWRLRGAGGRVHIPQLLVEHEGSASSGLGSPFYEERMVAAHVLLAAKLADNAWQHAIFLALRLVTLPARALWRAWRHRSTVPLRALVTGWRARTPGRLPPSGG